jgi:protein SCO1/2
VQTVSPGLFAQPWSEIASNRPCLSCARRQVANFAARQPKPPSTIALDPLLALTTQEGVALSASDLAGRSLAVAFGYTNCPVVCPTTLLDWSNVLEGLGTDAQRLQVQFVSVDSERDTPQTLKAYLRSFHPGITALTGTPTQIASVTALFDAAFAKHARPDGTFTYDHTIKTYLVDRERALFGTLDLSTEPAARLGLLDRLLARQERSG